MTIKKSRLKHLGNLFLSAATGAVLICTGLFGGWFISFILMDAVGMALLVGMNYLAWPIVFPLFSFPVVFLLLVIVIPVFKKPYPEILSHKGFLFGVLLPIFIIAIGLMLVTCPLETGGNLLTRGWSGLK